MVTTIVRMMRKRINGSRRGLRRWPGAAGLATLLVVPGLVGTFVETSRAQAANSNAASSASPALQQALTAAVTVPDARVDIVGLDRPGGDCGTSSVDARAEISRPIDGSGRFAVKLLGTRTHGGACEVWAWVRARVFAPVPVATRAIRPGDSLAHAVRTEEREIQPGHVPATLTDASTADRALATGQMVESQAVRAPSAKAGEMIKVLIVSGSLAVEQTGRAVPCGRDSACAVLPSGKHVTGVFADGRLMVQLP